MAENKTKIVFVGCGPTTLGGTYRIHEMIKNCQLSSDEVEVTVLEKEAVPGGLARSITDEMGFSWDLGVHVSGTTKYPCFTAALEGAVKDWNYLRRSVKADMQHIFGEEVDESDFSTYVPYPVQQAIPLFPKDLRDDCMRELYDIATQNFEKPPKNFYEWTWRAFGDTLLKIFIRPYNKKVWTVDLEEMNSTWVGERVATIDLKNMEEMFKKDKSELLKDDLGWGPNTWFRYPKLLKGVGCTWEKVAELQPQHWFRFNQQVVSIDPSSKKVKSTETKTGTELVTQYDHLISTMPLTLLGKMSSLAPSIGTEHSKVVLVGLGLKKPQSSWAQSVSWIYYPCSELVFYRCTVISNFNQIMTPDPDKYWSVICEIGLKPDEKVDQKYLVDKTIEGLISRKMFTSPEEVVDVFFMVLPYGYPIPTVARDQECAKAHAVLESNQIYSRGRFGGWKYEVANQDHSFAQGYELVGRILTGEEESVYKTGV